MTPGQPHPQEPEPTWEPYWITPPDIYKKLDDEFQFDFDPCPFPKPEGYDGTKVDWGKSNYVNPPFHNINGTGPTAFVRKAIEEAKKGKTIVLTLSTPSYVNLLLEAGAEVRSLGRVRWLHTVTRNPMKGPTPVTVFILKGCATHSNPPAADEGCPYYKHMICTINQEEHDAQVAKAAREQVLLEYAAWDDTRYTTQRINEFRRQNTSSSREA